MSPAVLYGRPSSHFTRVARLFADEFGAPYSLQPIGDLLSVEPSDYGGNPALKMPSLLLDGQLHFGALPIARALHASTGAPTHVVWPEQLPTPLCANAGELIVQAMSTEVTLILAEPAAGRWPDKLRRSLEGSLRWLDTRWPEIEAALPARELSFLEVSGFCLFTHLQFRQLLTLDAYPRLQQFAARWGERDSAQRTPYRFGA